MDIEVTEFLALLATALHREGQEISSPQEFFEAVDVDLKSDPSFDGFKPAFESRSLGPAAETLIRVLEELNNKDDVLRKLGEERVDDVVAECQQQLDRASTAGTPAQASPAAGGQDAQWNQVVQTYAGYFANCDGSDHHWTYYRDQFYGALAQADPSQAQYAMAYNKLSPLDQADAAQRVAGLREFGFTVEAPATAPEAGAAPTGTDAPATAAEAGTAPAGTDTEPEAGAAPTGEPAMKAQALINGYAPEALLTDALESLGADSSIAPEIAPALRAYLYEIAENQPQILAELTRDELKQQLMEALTEMAAPAA